MKKILSILMAVFLIIQIGRCTTYSEEKNDVSTLSSLDQAAELGFVPEDMKGDYSALCTRVEFCHFSVHLIEIQKDMSIDSYLKDKNLIPDDFFEDSKNKEVLALGALDIVNGFGNGKFAPDDSISREQAAVILFRIAVLFNVKDNADEVMIKDLSEISPFAVSAVQFAGMNKIMKVTTGNQFQPKNSLTREEAFTFMLRLNELINRQKSLIKICAIGNSLMYSGDTIGQLQKLCENAGIYIWVDNNLIGGAYLYDTVNGFDQMYGKNYFADEDFDFLLLNEHGSADFSLKQSLDKLFEFNFPDKTRILYMMSEFDEKSDRPPHRREDLSHFPRVEICNAYTLVQRMIDSKQYEEIEFDLTKGDYHPNELHAFINACSMFAMMFHKNPAEYVTKCCSLVHGATEEERMKGTVEIAQMVWDYTNGQ